MALSLFNFFVLEEEAVRLPFFFIDCGIILIVAFQVSGLKAADEARNLEAKRAYAKEKEAEKLALAGQKAEQRAVQRAQHASEKGSNKYNNNAPTNNIQQPDKKNK